MGHKTGMPCYIEGVRIHGRLIPEQMASKSSIMDELYFNAGTPEKSNTVIDNSSGHSITLTGEL